MNHSNYILRINPDTLFSFYYMNNSIYMRKFLSNTWSKAENIISDVRQSYSLSQFSGKIFLVCQENGGNILLLTLEGYVWTRKILLESSIKNSPVIYMKPIITDKGLELIYNLPENNSQALMRQLQLPDGKWEQPEKIDTLTPGQSFFKLISFNYVLYIKENCLYLLNIKNKKIAPLFSGNIIDYSGLYINDELHLCIITRVRSVLQVLYINNNKIKKIWEGSNCSLISIGYINKEIIISWNVGNRLFNIKNPFLSEEIIKKSADTYIKADYIPADNERVCFNDLILNTTKPDYIYFHHEEKVKEDKSDALQAEIYSLKQELNKKNSIINQLTGLKARNDELQQENNNLRQRYRELLEKYKQTADNQKQLPIIKE